VQNVDKNVTYSVVTGDRSALLQWLRANRVQTLFVGTRGTGPLSRAVLGSFSASMVHEAPCDVIVCRQTAQSLPPLPLQSQPAAVHHQKQPHGQHVHGKPLPPQAGRTL
jgi:hypothetical protein